MSPDTHKSHMESISSAQTTLHLELYLFTQSSLTAPHENYTETNAVSRANTGPPINNTAVLLSTLKGSGTLSST